MNDLAFFLIQNLLEGLYLLFGHLHVLCLRLVVDLGSRVFELLIVGEISQFDVPEHLLKHQIIRC